MPRMKEFLASTILGRLFGLEPQADAGGWTDEQRRVIETPADARMIVQGGPGTGKTAVACARIAHLIEAHGLTPSEITVISFTRVAVREIRERIAAMLADPKGVDGLAVLTLDSLAGKLSPRVEDVAGHDETVRHLARSLPLDPSIAAKVERWRHLLVDESHDVVGARADLTERLIAVLPEACGVTLLADDAQCIYGFADTSRLPKPALPQRLNWPTLPLTRIHRARDARLARLFRKGRDLALDSSLPAKTRYRRLLGEIRRAETAVDHSVTDQTLILYRRRAAVLAASAEWLKSGKAHRLRTSGHPNVIAPWIAQILSKATLPTLSHARFQSLWDENGKGLDLDVEDAWERLHRVAPAKGEIDMAGLRRRLQEASPPIDLCLTDVGTVGPTLSTIHAAKGREADHVVLTLPRSDPPHDHDGDHDGEESRIAFVGATRARSRLTVKSIIPVTGEILNSGRLVLAAPSPRSAALEIGRAGDIDPLCLAGRQLFATARDVENNQTSLRRCLKYLGTRPIALRARIADGGHYGLYLPDQPAPCAFLSPSVTEDMEEIRHRRFRGRAALPASLEDVFLVGLRTLAFHVADEQPPDVFFPWSESGLILAPVILGLGSQHFPDPTSS